MGNNNLQIQAFCYSVIIASAVFLLSAVLSVFYAVIDYNPLRLLNYLSPNSAVYFNIFSALKKNIFLNRLFSAMQELKVNAV